jgi:hypothetical protein
VALLAALANGAMYVLLVPPWQGPDEHAHYAYMAMLHEEDLDNGRVEQIFAQGKWDPALIAAVEASMNRHSFSQRVLGHSAPGAPANAGYSLFWQVHQPAPYYWLCAAAVRAGEGMGLDVSPIANPEGALLVMRAVSLALNLGVVAFAWLAGVLLSYGTAGASYWLRLLLPITVALLPMHAFVASLANNDILAELSVSALLVVLACLLRWPNGFRALALLALAVAITVASTRTKSSALAASVPLLGLGAIVWVGMLMTRAAHRWGHAARRGETIVPIALTLLSIAATCGAVLAMYEPQDKVAGWHIQGEIEDHPVRRVDKLARHGSYVLEFAPAKQESTAWQTVLPPVYHPAFDVTVRGWARTVQNGTSIPRPADPATALIRISEGGREAGLGEVDLDRSGTWTPLIATARISESAEQVLVTLTAQSGESAVRFDDLSLEVTGVTGPWRDNIYRPTLANPSAEMGALAIRSPLASVLPVEARTMADILADRQTYDKPALWRNYADGEYKSFWGNFGWVSIPLPDTLYAVLGILSIAALTGLGWLAFRLFGRWGAREWLGLISIITFVVAVLIGFAKQMAAILTDRVLAYPQGRYLFVLIIPVVWLLVVGSWQAWSLLCSGRRRLAASTIMSVEPPSGGKEEAADGQPVGLQWGMWLWLNGLFLLGAYCLLALIAPYYYG